MPQEIRKIIFSSEETLEALQERDGNGSVPVDRGLSLSIDEAGRCLNMALAMGPQGAAPRTSKRDVTEVGAALIKFCLDNGIPIPRGAKRALDLHDGKLALTLTIGDAEDPPKLDLPDFYEYDFFE